MVNPNQPDSTLEKPCQNPSSGPDSRPVESGTSSFCPVCGKSCAGEFCSKKCRTASTDYHNEAEKRIDKAYQKQAFFAFDPDYLPKPVQQPIIKRKLT